MSVPLSAQKFQLEYWLNFLQSSLDTTQSKWLVVIVGLQQDIQSAQLMDFDFLQTNWPSLNFYYEIFQVSSYTRFGILELKEKLALQCKELLDANAMQIPTTYRLVFDTLQVAQLPTIVKIEEIYNILEERGIDIGPIALRGLKYLHDIGMVRHQHQYTTDLFNRL